MLLFFWIALCVIFWVLSMYFGFYAYKRIGVENPAFKKYRKKQLIFMLLFLLCLSSPFLFYFIVDKITPTPKENAVVLENKGDWDDSELEGYELGEGETDFSDKQKELEKEAADLLEERMESIESQKEEKEEKKQEMEAFKADLVENSDGDIIEIKESPERFFYVTVSNSWFLLSENEKRYFAEELYSKFVVYGKYIYDKDFVSLIIYSESGEILARSSMGEMEIRE